MEKEGRLILKEILLSNNIKIPQLGMGGWAQGEREILEALSMGYRLLDTAAQYGNEEEIGSAIKHSGVKREDIVLTTKLWTEDVRNRNCRKAFEESLRRLKVDYIDLYLIHWPAQGIEYAWEIMEKLYDEGKIRAIGVSNFQIHHLKKIKKMEKYMPVSNQVEEHPYFTNQEVVDYCQKEKVAVEAWCPLGGPNSRALSNPVILDIARAHNRSNAQIILRWQIQRNIIVIPKASKMEHMKSNMEIFDFELSEDEMARITSLNKNMRLGSDPDNFKF